VKVRCEELLRGVGATVTTDRAAMVSSVFQALCTPVCTLNHSKPPVLETWRAGLRIGYTDPIQSNLTVGMASMAA
jgi:hypothetical protein